MTHEVRMTLKEGSDLAIILGTCLSFFTTVGTLWVLWKTLKLSKQSMDFSQQSANQSMDFARQSAQQSMDLARQSAQQSMDFARQSKQSDILLHCNERFGRLMEVRGTDLMKANPEIYYERFWTLQLHQFTHWKNGFVDKDVFDSWMRARQRQWIRHQAVGLGWCPTRETTIVQSRG
jgi:hypothetical protein